MPAEIVAGQLVLVVVAALVAGFVTGLVGFGTGLVLIGPWLLVLPASLTPPLVVITSVAGQLFSLPVVRGAIAWRPLSPYLAGAVIGTPLGVLALARASPELLRPAVGLFLMGFVVSEVVSARPREVGPGGGRAADALIGASSGFLGGFAGLPGPILIIWLRLRGGDSDSQRAVYQPFNLLVLVGAALVMSLDGRIDRTILVLASFSIPATLLGALLGVRYYKKIGGVGFRRAVLGVLLVAGLALLIQR